MTLENIFLALPMISLWELKITEAWPILTPGDGWQDLCRGPLDIATY